MLTAEPIADLSSASPAPYLLQFSFDQGSADAFSPSADHWSDHVTGRSIRRFAPKPRGSRPSIAAFARVGERKVSDNVMRIQRSIFSRGERFDGLVGTCRQFLQPPMGVAKRFDENRARFGSHRPHRRGLIAFALMSPAAKFQSHALLTSASVHDSQVAIPLMTMTSARVFYLYDLMDAAYAAAAIVAQSKALVCKQGARMLPPQPVADTVVNSSRGGL